MSKLKLLLGARVSAPPPPDPTEVAVANRAELDAAIATHATAGGVHIVCQDGGDFGVSNVQIHSRTPTGTIRIRPQSPGGAVLPGFEFIGSSNFIIEDCDCFVTRANALGSGVITFQNSSYITVQNNEIHADPLAEQVFIGTMTVSSVSGTFQHGERVLTETAGVPNGGSGYYWGPLSTPTSFAISGSASAPRTNPLGGSYATLWNNKTLRGETSGATCIVGAINSNIVFLTGLAGAAGGNHHIYSSGNYYHDLKWGIAGSGMDDCDHADETMRNIYQSFGDFSGSVSRTKLRNWRCESVWATSGDGQPSGTNGPHSSLLGLSQGIINTVLMGMVGCVFLVGLGRFLATGEYGRATAPKMNDNMCFATCDAFSGTTVVFTAANQSPGLINNSIRPGMMFYTRGMVPGTTIVSQTSSTEPGGVLGGAGTYEISISQTFAGGKCAIGSVADEWEHRNNIFVPNASLSYEIGACVNSLFRFNTMVSLPDTGLLSGGATPSTYLRDIGENCGIYGNVTCGWGAQAGTYIDVDTVQKSFGPYPNYTIIDGETTGAHSLNECYQGLGGDTPFHGATLENILEMLTPKAGGPLDGADIGHTAFFDWDTNTPVEVTMTPTAPTVAAGQDDFAVAFNGTPYARYLKGAEPAMDFSTPDELTMLFHVRTHFASTDAIFSAAQNSNIVVRRLISGAIRFNFKGSDGSDVTQIETFNTYGDEDDWMTLALSIKWSTGMVSAFKHTASGWLPEPFLKVTNWAALPLATTSTAVYFATDASAGVERVIDAKTVMITDKALAMYDQATLSKVVAQDGKPVAYGSDGSTMFGVPLRVLLAGTTLAEWNANPQKGTAPAWAIVNGPLVAAV